jgi:4-amino-4-deoxy-L-arabinose transferase-like glycosyltransferase
VQRVQKGRVRIETYLFFGVLVALIVFLTHLPLITLPFYWDELGQFIPASLDIFSAGAWVPYTTVPNVHPPGVMAYLAGVWSIFGYSIPITRLAMLLLASLGALVVFLLAIELARRTSGAPGFTALVLLCASPLFYAQAMLAQLDMPAMVLTCLALLMFLQDRIRTAALVCTALVMVKETGVVAPMIFGAWLLLEERGKRWRQALWFTLPLAPLALWLIYLRHSTGHLFGSPAFTEYNAFYNLRPVRLVLAMIRRLYYLFVGTFHWIGTLALLYAWKRMPALRERPWRIAASLATAHVLSVTLFGGAVLERYLLPVLPIVYIAFAVAFSACSPRWRVIAQAVMIPAMIAAIFINPLYPFPMENDLAFADFVRLHQKAAAFAQAHYPAGVIATTFPLASALRRPEMGYVKRPMKVREVNDFRGANVEPLRAENIQALILYTSAWDPLHLLDQRQFARFLHHYYGYEPQLTESEVEQTLGMHRVAQWTQRGQWIEVLERDGSVIRVRGEWPVQRTALSGRRPEMPPI